MTVMILAGGFGTRLSHIVKDVPKPMAPIRQGESGDVPFLEILIRTLKKQNFSDIILLTGHKSQVIEDYFKDGKNFGVNIRYSVETSPLGTGGAIKDAARKYQVTDDFLVLNGDTFFDVDYSYLADFHKRRGGAFTIALKYKADVKRYGMVRIENYEIREFVEKNPSLEDGFINGGIYAVSPKALDAFHKEGMLSFESEVMPVLLKSAKVHALPFGGRFIDIGVPEDYYRANDVLVKWMQEPKKKIAFLDRDGVLNVDTGYTHKPEELKLVDGVIPFLKALASRGFEFIITTNQAGIAKGKFTHSDFESFQKALIHKLKSEGITILDTFFCPFHDKGTISEFTKDSLLRKPEPGMYLEAADKWNIDFTQSIMVGDKESDAIKLPYLKSYLLKGNYPISEGMKVYADFEEMLKEI